ncbi:hypothetical protein GGX14DRAFT_563370 [Mycena pura]|uniref:Uncharacterized protein n=1 Tax=Mycena pura TaxID=153505 RepID=A0AAD6VKX1_9AGAR|nr:hypothetical protein GGX14DRAFT_563370 [Mycena pura]
MSDQPQAAPLPALSAEDQKHYDDLLRWLDLKLDPGDDAGADEDEPPRKRRKCNSSTWEEDSAPYDAIRAARYFKRAIHAHLIISLIFSYGAQAVWTDKTISAQEQRAPYVAAFKEFLRRVPELDRVLRHMYASSKRHWRGFVEKFDELAKDVRSNDTTAIKAITGTLLLPNPEKDVLDPPISGRVAKSDRGFGHPILRLLLMGVPDRMCFVPTHYRSRPAPAEDLRTEEQRARETEIMRLIATHQYTRHQQQYPSFLYADDSFTEDDPRIGLCRGDFVIRLLRHVWTTPRSALRGLGGKSLPPDSNARIQEAEKVTAPMVGYVVSQGYVALLPGDWDKVDDKDSLYDRILDLFASSPLWAKRTLKFLTKEVFGDSTRVQDGNDEENRDDASPEQNHVARMAELARLEREAAAAGDDDDDED